MKKRIFALVLALVLCLSVLPLGALAEDKPVYRIVNVGDSTGIGIGLNDCGIHQQEDVWSCLTQWSGTKNKGYFDYMSPRSSYALLAQYVREELSDYTVESVNLGRTGIRASEFRELINRDYEGDVYAQEVADTVRTDLPRAFDLGAFGTDVDGYYVDQISKADLINVDASLNSFTWYLVDRLSASDDDPRFQESVLDLLAIGTPQMKTQLNCLEQTLKSTVGALLPKNIATRLIDTVLYCTMDMFVNFDGLIRDIRKLNPTAKLLVGGVYNAFSGLTLEYEGYELEITDLLDAGVALIDEYLSTLCPSRREYTFFDIPNDTETIRMQLQQYESIWELPVETLDRAIDDLFGGDHSLIATPLCVYIRSLAAERGIPYGIYSGIYPREVFAAFEEVRAMREGGPEADAMTQLVVEYFEKYLQLALDGLNTTTLDVPGLIEAFSLENPYLALFELIDIPFEELTPAQKTLAHYVGSKLRGGACVHFSRLGCEQKFEAAKAELDKELPTPILCYSVHYTNQLTTGIVRTILKAVRLITRSASRLLTGFLK